MTEGHPAGTGNDPKPSSGAGAVDDALTPFTDALTAAGKAAMADSAGNPKVIAAVKLGWLMRELTAGWSTQPLPSGLSLSGAGASRAQARQLSTLLEILKLTALASELAVTEMLTALQTGPDTRRARDLEDELVIYLVGTDARFPTAFALGHGLRALMPQTTPAGASREPAGTPMPTKPLVDALDALSADLPSHAARGIANSLGSWLQSSDAQKAALAEAQVILWRSVLVGEKKGTELLEPEDYLEAAAKLGHQYAQQALKSRWILGIAGVALALFIGGVVFLLAANGHAGNIAAGASGVLVALGLTWKGIGGTLGKLAGRLEAPLWGAELDMAITDKITLTEPTVAEAPKPAELSYARRRARVLSTRPR